MKVWSEFSSGNLGWTWASDFCRMRQTNKQKTVLKFLEPIQWNENKFADRPFPTTYSLLINYMLLCWLLSHSSLYEFKMTWKYKILTWKLGIASPACGYCRTRGWLARHYMHNLNNNKTKKLVYVCVFVH